MLALRRELWSLNLRGFQWIDGSFVEDIEMQDGRAPGDVDVVTFFGSTDKLAAYNQAVAQNSPLLQRAHVKATFHVDHFRLPLTSHPVQIVEQTKYWYGLFSHRRDRTWKGMLQVDLSEPNDVVAN